MKKQTSPKHRYLLLGVVATMLLLVGSCKKELTQYNSSANFQPLDGAKLNSLKKSYGQDQNIVLNIDNWLNTFSPNWSKVNEQKLEKGSVYEIMLNNPQEIFATDGMVDLKDAKKKYANKSSIRLLIFIDEQGQNHKACFMEVIATGESELPTQLSYKNYGNLNGLVSFYELDGKLANGWVYSNGRAVMSTSVNGMQTKGTSSNAKSSSNGRIMFQEGPPEGFKDCGTRLVAEIRTVCGEVGGLEGPGYDGEEGSGKGCRDQMYFVSERIYCSIPSGPNDGQYDPPNPTTPGTGGNAFTINPNALKDCMKKIIDSLKKSTKGNVAAIIQQFAGDTPGYNWTLKDGILSSSSANAMTSTQYNRTVGIVTTIFDSRKFTAASDLSVARTILHESVHAYLVAYFFSNLLDAKQTYSEYFEEWNKYKNRSLNTLQHNEIARNFVAHIGDALREYGDKAGYTFASQAEKEQYYNDLAWGGLTDTRAFKDLSTTDRDRIEDVIGSEMFGLDRLGNPKAAKGTMSGCK